MPLKAQSINLDRSLMIKDQLKIHYWISFGVESKYTSQENQVLGAEDHGVGVWV